MSDSLVFWPDLTRFGAQLQVVVNRSVGSNFLKFSVKDRVTFETTCGLGSDDDLYRLMHDNGFALATTEMRSVGRKAYEVAYAAGADDVACSRAALSGQELPVFYSASLVVKKELLQQFIPALREDDFQQLPMSTVKVLDYAYVAEQDVAGLAQRLLHFPDCEYGVYYTIPRDRLISSNAATSRASLHALLDYRSFPREQAEKFGLDANLVEYQKFQPYLLTETLMRGQTQSPTGLPLKAPRPAATDIVYPSKAAAISANGNSETGILSVSYPYAIPLAFDVNDERILLLKDARFVEIVNANYLPDAADKVIGISDMWTNIGKVDALAGLFSDIEKNGIDQRERWTDRNWFDTVLAHVVRVNDVFKTMGFDGNKRGIPEHILSLVGLRVAAFEKKFGLELLPKLSQYADLLTAVEKCQQGFLAQDALADGQTRAKEAIVAKIDAAVDRDRREDAGVKIGGARKDYAKSWLLSSEISGLSPRERADVVTKDNVWPPLDYVKMRDNGVCPEVAMMIRDLRAALPVNPLRGGFNGSQSVLRSRASKEMTPKICEDFVNAVTLVRNCIADAKTPGDLLEGILEIRQKAGLSYDVRLGGGKVDRINDDRCFSVNNSFDDGAGYKFVERTLPNITVIDGVTTSYFGQRQLTAAFAKSAGKWDWAIKEKQNSDVDAQPEKKVKRPEPEIPHLDDIRRVGADYRLGVDADEKMFMDAFGFRAIEYGNWLAQRERQVVLNHAFDSFMDLANALQLPPSAMSLGGDLAIAFGARGTGGKGAAMAHYEPGRNVINLTKISGAGSVAHEWGHAFDYYLASAMMLSSVNAVTTSMGDVTERRNGVSELLFDFNKITTEGRSKALSLDEVAAKVLQVVVKAKGEKKAQSTNENINTYAKRVLLQWVRNIDAGLPEEMRNGSFKEFAITSLDTCFIDDADLENYGCKSLRGLKDWTKSVYDAFRVATNREVDKYVNRDYPLSVEQWHRKVVERFNQTVANFVPGRVFGDSRYLSDAAYYDDYRSKPYWSTRIEMFARSFESYVQDRIESVDGHVSQYLVHGRSENLLAEYSAYPRGDDRVRIGAAMDHFFETHRPQLIRMLDIKSKSLANEALKDSAVSIEC